MKPFYFFLLLCCLSGCRQAPRGEKAWPYELEGLKMEKKGVAFGNIYYGEKVTDTIRIRNVSGYVWEGRFNYDLHFMLVKAGPYLLEPEEEGMIVVEFDTEKYGKYDEYIGHIQCRNAGRGAGMLYMPVTALITENFAGLMAQEKTDAPVVEADSVFHFGQVEAGEEVVWNVRIRNTGKKDLIIRNIKTTCGCTAADPDSRVIASGCESLLKVTFRTAGRSGHQHKTIVLTTNDYRRPQLLLHLEGEVVRGNSES